MRDRVGAAMSRLAAMSRSARRRLRLASIEARRSWEATRPMQTPMLLQPGYVRADSDEAHLAFQERTGFQEWLEGACASAYESPIEDVRAELMARGPRHSTSSPAAA